jgi:hypothetical protein
MTVEDGLITEPKLAADDEVASTFFLGPVIQDFGSAATAVATKLTDAAPASSKFWPSMQQLSRLKPEDRGTTPPSWQKMPQAQRP